MKCVKLFEEGIVRVPDAKAVKLVNSGRGIYCSKKEWKTEVRDIKKEK